MRIDAVEVPGKGARAAAVAAVLVLAVPAVGLAGPPLDPMVNQRPIEEVVAAQGTYWVVMGSNPACVLLEPPVGKILGWISIQDGVRCFAKGLRRERARVNAGRPPGSRSRASRPAARRSP